MSQYGFYVDTSRCIKCWACQVACKQWNELPATDTVQTGSYQNPPDMNGDTYKIVRFREGRHENGKPYWNFFTDMCRPRNPVTEILDGVEYLCLGVETETGVVPRIRRERFRRASRRLSVPHPPQERKDRGHREVYHVHRQDQRGRHSRVRAVLSHRSHALRGTRRHARTRAQARGGAEEGVPQGPCRRS